MVIHWVTRVIAPLTPNYDAEKNQADAYNIWHLPALNGWERWIEILDFRLETYIFLFYIIKVEEHKNPYHK